MLFQMLFQPVYKALTKTKSPGTEEARPAEQWIHTSSSPLKRGKSLRNRGIEPVKYSKISKEMGGIELSNPPC